MSARAAEPPTPTPHRVCDGKDPPESPPTILDEGLGCPSLRSWGNGGLASHVLGVQQPSGGLREDWIPHKLARELMLLAPLRDGA